MYKLLLLLLLLPVTGLSQVLYLEELPRGIDAPKDLSCDTIAGQSLESSQTWRTFYYLVNEHDSAGRVIKQTVLGLDKKPTSYGVYSYIGKDIINQGVMYMVTDTGNILGLINRVVFDNKGRTDSFISEVYHYPHTSSYKHKFYYDPLGRIQSMAAGLESINGKDSMVYTYSGTDTASVTNYMIDRFFPEEKVIGKSTTYFDTLGYDEVKITYYDTAYSYQDTAFDFSFIDGEFYKRVSDKNITGVRYKMTSPFTLGDTISYDWYMNNDPYTLTITFAKDGRQLPGARVRTAPQEIRHSGNLISKSDGTFRYICKDYISTCHQGLSNPVAVLQGNSSNPQAQIKWTNNSTCNVVIQRLDISKHYFEWKTLDSLSASDTIYADNLIVAGRTYRYKVGTYDLTGIGGFSKLVEVKIPFLPISSYAKALFDTLAGRISVNWQYQDSTHDGFILERSLDTSGTWTVVDSLSPNLRTYIDSGLLMDTVYFYRIAAYYGSNRSAFVTAWDTTYPKTAFAPTGLFAQGLQKKDDAIISLAWLDNANNEEGFHLQRSTDAADWQALAILQRNTTLYHDTAVERGQKYYYRLYAFNRSGLSAPSNTAFETTLPDAPATLSANLTNAVNVDLSWIHDQAAHQGFILQRTQDSTAGWAVLDSVSSTSSSYLDDNLLPNTQYHYRVYAWNEGGWSLPSNTVTITTSETIGLGLSSPRKVAVYPNPTNGYFSVSFGDMPGNAVLQLLNIQGQVVWQNQVTAATKQVEINLPELSEGLYLLQRNGEAVGKVSVRR